MTGHHFISYDIGRPAGQEIVVHDSDHQTQKRPLEWTAEVKASAELALNLYAKVGSTWKFPDVVELTATAGFKFVESRAVVFKIHIRLQRTILISVFFLSTGCPSMRWENWRRKLAAQFPNWVTPTRLRKAFAKQRK